MMLLKVMQILFIKGAFIFNETTKDLSTIKSITRNAGAKPINIPTDEATLNNLKELIINSNTNSYDNNKSFLEILDEQITSHNATYDNVNINIEAIINQFFQYLGISQSSLADPLKKYLNDNRAGIGLKPIHPDHLDSYILFFIVNGKDLLGSQEEIDRILGIQTELKSKIDAFDELAKKYVQILHYDDANQYDIDSEINNIRISYNFSSDSNIKSSTDKIKKKYERNC